MSYSATRLTCFAILSAMEEDLRATIEQHLGDLTLSEVLPEERIERANGRRVKDGLRSSGELPALLPYVDFGDSLEALASHSGTLPSEVRSQIGQLSTVCPRVVAIRNRVAHTRPMEIDDSSFLIDTARSLLGRPGTSWEALSSVMTKLEQDPSYVLGLTISLPADAEPGPQHNLPVPDFDETGFFGRQDELRRIKKAIKGAYPVVSILGDGGIGKTSIALKAAYDLLDDPGQPFDAFVWVSAKATILTPTEIRRINGAIESSLGLFASATNQLAGEQAADPVAEVLAYMENFKILLLLDNLETVLDSRLRDFLLDLPMGSKVIITSRIGLGIENPVTLAPLSTEESARLLRALARVRNVQQLTGLHQDTVSKLAATMAGHPAYLRWFVAGVQAGRRPEELLSNNELLLDFCMSNVFEYLSPDAHAVLRSMQVVGGAKNQAEVAYLNDFTATQTQSALLELLTTNFVQMNSLVTANVFDTGYEISEFARQYLDKHHPVSPEERDWLVARNQALRNLGLQMAAENTATPYASTTVHVRGPGDFHAAGLLREGISVATVDPNRGLELCKEAQLLAPGYFEAWRVDAYVRALTLDSVGASASYERALELASESATARFHFGEYLLNSEAGVQRALELLQQAARLDPASPEIAAQISWAHFCLGDMATAIEVSGSVIGMQDAPATMRRAAGVLATRATYEGVNRAMAVGNLDAAVECVELALEQLDAREPILLDGEAADTLIAVRAQTERLAQESVDYVARRSVEFAKRIGSMLDTIPGGASARSLGIVRSVVREKGYGFIRAGGADYFFHVRDLVDPSNWEALIVGDEGVFCPNPSHPRGLRAERMRRVGAPSTWR